MEKKSHFFLKFSRIFLTMSAYRVILYQYYGKKKFGKSDKQWSSYDFFEKLASYGGTTHSKITPHVQCFCVKLNSRECAIIIQNYFGKIQNYFEENQAVPEGLRSYWQA